MFGIFQEYYSTHDILQGDKGDLATVGTTSTVWKRRSIPPLPGVEVNSISHNRTGSSIPLVTCHLYPPGAVSTPPSLVHPNGASNHRDRFSSIVRFAASMASHCNPGGDVCRRQRTHVQSVVSVYGPVVHSEKGSCPGDHVGGQEYYWCCLTFCSQCLLG